MPLVTDKPQGSGPVLPTSPVTTPPLPDNHLPTPPAIYPPDYLDTPEDNRYVPRQSLLTFVQGASWTVDYYSQLLGRDSELSVQQVGLPVPNQQYTKYINLELKVTQALQQQQDETTKIMTVQGAANVYPGMIPNKGDMFVARDPDGNKILLAVTNSEKKAMTKDAMYAIEYMVAGYLDQKREADFAAKTVRTVYFMKDYLYHGRNPYITTEKFGELREIARWYRRMISDYMATFFSTEFQVLMVPDQAAPTYDHFINEKVIAWFDQNLHPNLQRLQPLNVNSDQVFKMPTVLDAIQKMDDTVLPTAVQKILLANTGYLRDYPALNGVFWSGIRYLIYPADRRTDVDRFYQGCVAPTVYGQQPQQGYPRWRDLNRVLADNDLGSIDAPQSTDELPDIVPVDPSYYIFSQNFYDPSNGPLASKFEVAVRNALERRAPDIQLLGRLAAQAQSWNNLERFYYVPILGAMLKVALTRGC